MKPTRNQEYLGMMPNSALAEELENEVAFKLKIYILNLFVTDSKF
jgi:hypothetical protein